MKQLDGTGMKRLHRDWRRRTEGGSPSCSTTCRARSTSAPSSAPPPPSESRTCGWRGARPTPTMPRWARRPSAPQRYLTFHRADATVAAIDAARSAGYRVVGLELADGAAPAARAARRPTRRASSSGTRTEVQRATLDACETRSPTSRSSAGWVAERGHGGLIALYELRRGRWTDAPLSENSEGPHAVGGLRRGRLLAAAGQGRIAQRRHRRVHRALRAPSPGMGRSGNSHDPRPTRDVASRPWWSRSTHPARRRARRRRPRRQPRHARLGHRRGERGLGVAHRRRARAGRVLRRRRAGRVRAATSTPSSRCRAAPTSPPPA